MSILNFSFLYAEESILKKSELLSLNDNWKCTNYSNYKLNKTNFEAQTFSVPLYWAYSSLGTSKSIYCQKKILVRDLESFSTIGIFTYSIINAHEIYINNHKIGGQGKIIDGNLIEANARPYLQLFPKELLKEGKNTISLLVADQGNAGAILEQPILGDSSIIEKYFIFWILRHGSISLFMIFIGIYHLVMFFSNRLESSYLYFSLICVSCGLFTFSFMRFTYWIIPNFLFHYSIFHFNLFISAITIPFFVYKLFDLKIDKFAKGIIIPYSICLVFAIFGLINENFLNFYRNYIFVYIVPLINFSLCIFLFRTNYLIRKKAKKEAIIMSIGLFFATLAAIFSVLRHLNIGIKNLYTIEGFLFLILCTAITISIKIRGIQEKLINLESDFSTELVKEVYEKTEQLIELNSTLEKSNILKNKLFSILAHELRSPLQSLIEITELFRGKNLNKIVLSKEMKKISLEIHNNKYLLENTLHWTNAQFLNSKIEVKQININSIIIENYLQFEKNIKSKKLKFINQFDKSIYCIGDKNIINLVIRNLISNSIKYTPQKGKIQIGYELHTNSCKIFIRDSGFGFANEKIEFIKNGLPLDSELGTENEKGIGIGLHISNLFLNKINSKLSIISKQKKGSEVSFELPINI